MLSQIATRVTVSMAFLAAALVFSPYPLLDQSRGPSPPHSISRDAAHLAQSSNQFAGHIREERREMEASELDKQAQQVDHFRDSLLDAVDSHKSIEESRSEDTKTGAEDLLTGSYDIGEAASQRLMKGAEKLATTGQESLRTAGESAVAFKDELAQEALPELHQLESSGEAALQKTSEAGAQILEAASPTLDAVKTAPERLEKGSEIGAHSLLDSLGKVVENVKEHIEPGMQKAKSVGQGLKEKLETVTAHIRESSTWPEPEAISIMAEGVWAPKEHNPLPDLSRLLDPARAQVDPEHTESSIEEKLGIHMGHGASSYGSIQQFLAESSLWSALRRRFEQAVQYLGLAGGPFHTDSSMLPEVHRVVGLRAVHVAVVSIHLGTAFWLLTKAVFWVLGHERLDTGKENAWRQSALVEAACSTVALITFLFLYPWRMSGARERNEVQVLLGTAADSLVRLMWDSRLFWRKSAVSTEVPIHKQEVMNKNSSPLSKKRNKKNKNLPVVVDNALPAAHKSPLRSYGLSGLLSLLTRLSVVVALCFHLVFLGRG